MTLCDGRLYSWYIFWSWTYNNSWMYGLVKRRWNILCRKGPCCIWKQHDYWGRSNGNTLKFPQLSVPKNHEKENSGSKMLTFSICETGHTECSTCRVIEYSDKNHKTLPHYIRCYRRFLSWFSLLSTGNNVIIEACERNSNCVLKKILLYLNYG